MNEEELALKEYIDNCIKELEWLNSCMQNIRKVCTHRVFITKAGGNTGNYDPSTDIYWTNFTCCICKHQWTVYSK
jgi:pantothenate kinase